MKTHWYVLKVTEDKVEISAAEKKPKFILEDSAECFYDGTEGEDGNYCGGFIAGYIGIQ
jgi:hypothetical protein